MKSTIILLMSENSDHDALITLINEVKNLKQGITDGMRSVEKKIDDTFSGVKAQVTEHEARLKVIELIQQKTEPEQTAKDVSDMKEWRKQFSVTWKLIIITSSTIGAVVGFILSLVTSAQHLLH